MKRLFIPLAAGLVAVAVLGTAEAAKRHSAARTPICHRTTSNKPGHAYVRVVLRTKAALAHHRRHPQDIIPAGGACPKRGVTPTRGGRVVTATLTGAAEVPPGDLDGTGTVTLRMIPGTAYLCFTIAVQNIMLPAMAAHVHQAPVAQAGPVVIPLTAPDASGKSSGCTNVVKSGTTTLDRTLVRAILADPTMYYVNVHTTDHPAGAVRGQLTG